MLKGVITALITPMKEDLSVDLDGLQALIRRQLAANIDGILVCGSTGEGPLLNHQERTAIIDCARRLIPSHVALWVGISGSNPQQFLEEAQSYQKYAPDAFLISPPDYMRPTQKGIYQFYQHLDQELSTPIVIYNHPGRTGTLIQSNTLIELSKLPNVQGIKDASGNLALTDATLQELSPSCGLYSGDDASTLALVSLGAKGVVSVASNLLPKEMLQLTHRALSGEMAPALDVHRKLFSLIHALGIENNPIPIKYAMQSKGLPSGSPRPPLLPLSPSLRDSLHHLLNQEGACLASL